MEKFLLLYYHSNRLNTTVMKKYIYIYTQNIVGLNILNLQQHGR